MGGEQQVRVTSEIGPLRSVICHTPGTELLAVTPATREDFLYDDIIDLEQARREHHRFTALLSRFADHEHGGFWFTPHDHETLIQRPKGYVEDATPNGNGVAARALGRLGHLLGETRYLDAAATTVEAAVAAFGDWPQAHAAVLLALDEQMEPPTLEIYRGTAERLARVSARHGLVFRIPTGPDRLPGQLANQPALDGALTLYRCVGSQCEAPQRLV